MLTRFTIRSLLFAALATGVGSCSEDALDDDTTDGPSDDDDDDNDDDDDDTAGDLDWDVQAQVSEHMPTFVTVQWSVEEDDPGAPAVEIGIGGAFDRRVEGASDGTGGFTAAVAGLKTSTVYNLRATVEVGGDVLRSPVESVETGPEPPWLPEATLHVDDPDESFSGYLVTAISAPTPFAAILDEDGDWVWWWAHEEGEGAVMARATLSVDGRSLLFLPFTPDPDDDDPGPIRVQLDGSGEERYEIEGSAHHDFAERSDGTLVMLQYDRRMLDDEDVYGHRLVERAPDGTQTEIWTMWDHDEYTPEDPPTVMGQWGHANALQLDEASGTYHISLRHYGSIDSIDRATGEIVQSIGGDRSDFTLLGSTDLFSGQHGFEVLGDGVLVFDNWSEDGTFSRAVEYRLDQGTGEAEQRWAHVADPLLLVPTFGDVLTLPGEDRMVVWSTSGQIDQVNPDGEVVWQLNLAMGAAFGYVEWVEDLPAP